LENSSTAEILSFVISSAGLTELEVSHEVSVLLETASQIGFACEFIVISPISQPIGSGVLHSDQPSIPHQFVIVGLNDSWDQQMFAGLTRANGDYVLVIGSPADEISKDLVGMLSEMKSSKIDVVGLNMNRESSFFGLLSRRQILIRKLRRRFGDHVSLDNSRDLLIARRALNWIIRDLPTSNSLFEIALIPGLSFRILHTDNRISRTSMNSDLYFSVLSRYTRVTLNSIRFSFFLTFTVTFLTAINAIFVREFGRNLFGHAEIQVPGWTTIVLLLSFGFTTVLYGMYLMLRSIFFLRDELVHRPKYIVKGVHRG
jgi:hypothetical protein